MRFLPVLVALLLGACRDHEGTVSSVRDSAGVTIVENATPAWGGGPYPLLLPEPVLDLGAADAPPEFQFESLVDAASLPLRGYVVADRRRNQLLFYDERGDYLLSSGGPGEGPGEFRELGAVEVVGDSILAFDWRQGRLTVLSLDGELTGTVQLDTTGDELHPTHTYNLAGILGRELVLAPWAIMPLGHSEVGPYWDSAPILFYGVDGKVRRELPEAYRTEMFVGTQGASGRPFGARTSLAVRGTQVFLGTGESYEVRVFDGEGVLRRIIRRAWGPRPVTSSVVDSLIAFRIRRSGATSPSDPRARGFRQMLTSAPMPDHMPAFSWLLTDPQGHLWVRNYAAPYEEGPENWSLFDGEGGWLGNVAMPERFQVFGFGEEEILGMWRDSLNVQHFRVYGLDWPERAER